MYTLLLLCYTIKNIDFYSFQIVIVFRIDTVINRIKDNGPYRLHYQKSQLIFLINLNNQMSLSLQESMLDP